MNVVLVHVVAQTDDLQRHLFDDMQVMSRSRMTDRMLSRMPFDLTLTLLLSLVSAVVSLVSAVV